MAQLEPPGRDGIAGFTNATHLTDRSLKPIEVHRRERRRPRPAAAEATTEERLGNESLSLCFHSRLRSGSRSPTAEANFSRAAKWETFSESEPAFPEESLGCASVLESFHEYMRRALGRSYYRGEPQTRPRRHAYGSAFFRSPQAPCRACGSESSPHNADSPASREYYDDAWPLPFWTLIEFIGFELSVNPAAE